MVRVGGALGAKVVPRMLRIVVGPRVRERLHRGGIVARCTPNTFGLAGYAAELPCR